MAPSSVLKPHIQKLQPYKPPLDGRDIEKHLLLDFNERTVPTAQHVVDALKAHLDRGSLQMYPAYGDLQAEIAAYAGVPTEQCMFLNGSDQGIDLVIRSCCKEGSEIIIPTPTFNMYEAAALAEGLVIKSPKFTIEKGFPAEEVQAAITPNTSLVVFAQPNNPTGTGIPKSTILRIAEKNPNVGMLVDECYFEFMDPDTTVKDELARLPNIFLTRTFSKTWGLASLRIAYLLSAKENIDGLCCVRGPYDINHLAVVALRAALKDTKYVFDFVNEVNKVSKPAFEKFLHRKGIRFWPSACNFIFCYFDKPDELEARLRERNILVRPKKDAEGIWGLRVSIGTMEQTSRLISELEELVPNFQMTNGSSSKRQQMVSAL